MHKGRKIPEGKQCAVLNQQGRGGSAVPEQEVHVCGIKVEGLSALQASEHQRQLG